jgi:exopolysaccharide biosynthesis polyprenyl glycosylphosphotransferase
MITQRTRGLNMMVSLCLIFISACFFWGYLWMFQAIYHPKEPIFEHYVVYSMLVSLGLFYQAITGDFLDRNPLGQGFITVQATSFRQISYVAAFLLIYLVAAKDKTISRVFIFTFLPLLYVVLLGVNYRLPPWMAQRLFQGWRADKTLLVGSPKSLVKLKPWANAKREMGLRTVGVLCDDTTVGSHVEGYPVLGTLKQLPKVLHDHVVTQVILAELPSEEDQLAVIAEQCDAAGARFLVVANFEEKFRHSITMLTDEGIRFIGMRREPLENPMNRTLKRILDIVVALPVVLFILPLITTVVWFFQRLQSPGSVFYHQDRAGFHDLPFKIVKYRTMHTNNRDVARQASVDDDRIYPAGRVFRRFSLDEFPQFINVLKGQMSVVGPRPHLPQHNEAFAKIMGSYRVRTLVKPGITGLAQVRGFRGETKDEASLIARVESDIAYVENWSFTMDLVIILRTAWQLVFPPKTAY